jgi:hypothetical protein
MRARSLSAHDTAIEMPIRARNATPILYLFNNTKVALSWPSEEIGLLAAPSIGCL